MPEIRPLAGDLLSGVAAISQYMFGDDSPEHQRRVRHRSTPDYQSKRVLRRVESRKSWIDEAYSEPDPLSNGDSEK